MSTPPTPRAVVRTLALGLAAMSLFAATLGDTHHAEAGTSGNGRSVHGTCQAVAGAYTDLNTMTFGIRAHAEAHDTRWTAVKFQIDRPSLNANKDDVPVPPPVRVADDVSGTATSVTCIVRDLVTGEAYGQVAAGQPGPMATAAGSIEIPADRYVRAQVCVTALFLDGERLSDCD